MVDIPDDSERTPSTKSLKRSRWNMGRGGPHQVVMTFGDASEAHAWALWLLAREDGRRKSVPASASPVKITPAQSALFPTAAPEPPKGHWCKKRVKEGMQIRYLKQFVLDS